MAYDTQPAGIDRRRLLKQFGAGTAIAWTAPVLMTVASPAAAASAPCSLYNRAPSPPCPDTATGGCHYTLVNGRCFCWGDVAFNTVQPLCQTDADCGGNGICAPVGSNCGAVGGVACYYPCSPGPKG